MIAEECVRMQKERKSAGEIAAALGLHVNTVRALWNSMGYDPIAYHGESIRAAIADGYSYCATMDMHGIGRGREVTAGLARLGLDREELVSHKGQHTRATLLARAEDTRPKCAACEILIEPYDADNAEQQEWGNGTRDGIHCTVCEDILAHGGGYIQWTQLSSNTCELEGWE